MAKWTLLPHRRGIFARALLARILGWSVPEHDNRVIRSDDRHLPSAASASNRVVAAHARPAIAPGPNQTGINAAIAKPKQDPLAQGVCLHPIHPGHYVTQLGR